MLHICTSSHDKLQMLNIFFFYLNPVPNLCLILLADEFWFGISNSAHLPYQSMEQIKTLMELQK